MRYFCTLFDRNYIDRGLALYRSLERHAGAFKLYVLSLDRATEDALAALRLERVECLGLEALQSWDGQLARARGNRGLVEFYFTCKPILLAYVLSSEPAAARVEYLDSDLFLLASPSLVESAYADSSVALSPHRFDAVNAWRRRYGEYNAGWVSVAASGEGREFVAWWRARCLESCALIPGREVFGDQKYLDCVPTLFPGAAIAPDGINVGPWNIAGRAVELAQGSVRIRGQPLVFFHFHGTRRMLFDLHESGLHDYGVALTPVIRDSLYRPYVCELVRGRRDLTSLPRALRRPLVAPAPGAVSRPRRLLRTLRAVLRHTTVSAA